MPDIPNVAPSQPAPAAQTVDAVKSNGPENVGVSQYARQFLNKPAEPTPAPAPEPITAEPTVAPVEPAAQAPTETATQPEPDHATEADEALSQSTSIAPEIQEVINKRIAKITAKRKDAERRADAAEAEKRVLTEQLARASQTQPQTTQAPVSADLPNQPLAKVKTIQELQKLYQDATEATRFAEYNLDRDDTVERQLEGGQVAKGVMVGNDFYTKEQLRTIKYNAQRTKETEIPARAQFLTAQHQATQQAIELYPFLKDPASPEYQLADQAYREQPWLQNLPNSALLVGRMILGFKAEQDLLKGKTQAKPTPARPKPSGDQTAVTSADVGITRAPVGTAARQALAQEEAKLAKQGGVSAGDYAALLTRKAQIRRTS